MENRYIEIKQTGYGHWKITIVYCGKRISCITTDSKAIDDYNSEEGERDGRELRSKRGYLQLRDEIIRKNKA